MAFNSHRMLGTRQSLLHFHAVMFIPMALSTNIIHSLCFRLQRLHFRGVEAGVGAAAEGLTTPDRWACQVPLQRQALVCN